MAAASAVAALLLRGWCWKECWIEAGERVLTWSADESVLQSAGRSAVPCARAESGNRWVLHLFFFLSFSTRWFPSFDGSLCLFNRASFA